jgi:hypothetical protein
MHSAMKLTMLFSLGLLAASSVTAQVEPARHERRPAASTEPIPADAPAQKQPKYDFFSILDGTPKGLELHHDTEARTGKPIDVYVFPIELQVLNSDGDLEPEGLIIDNFYTAKPVDPKTAPNPHNARDCEIWNALVLDEIKDQNPRSHTWSYVEFTVARGARTLETNEDGRVWWSDDIECWGARDRFPPF